MRILFYIVHPAKYFLLRQTINDLIKEHCVEIIINSKDVLEDLVRSEGWKYKNIFPKGRNVSSTPSLTKSAFKFLLTVWRLEKYILNRQKYDVFVTDDSLVVNGWLHKIKTFLFVDNDIQTIKAIKVLFYFADFIISPYTTDLGKFNNKKLAFKGNKATAHLHPSQFQPNIGIIHKYGFQIENYILLRLANLNATHDINENKGITDEDVKSLLTLLKGNYKIVILAERSLSDDLRIHSYPGAPKELHDFIAYAKLVISDSGTVATEAAVLGTPNILVNKLAKNIGVHKELRSAQLQYYFDTFDEALPMIKEILYERDINRNWEDRRDAYLENCDDLNRFFKEQVLGYYEK